MVVVVVVVLVRLRGREKVGRRERQNPAES
jgi:hypothetical protein